MSAIRTKKRRPTGKPPSAPAPSRSQGVVLGFVVLALVGGLLGMRWLNRHPSAYERGLEAEFDRIEREGQRDRELRLTVQEREAIDRAVEESDRRWRERNQ